MISNRFKTKAPLFFICTTITVASYLILRDHQTTNLGLGTNSDSIYKMESWLFDIKIKLRGPEPITEEFGVLAIDEATIQKFGEWPFPRRFYANALKNLKKLGVQWIGFDAVFSDHQGTQLVEIKDEIDRIKKNTDLRKMTKGLTEIERWYQESYGSEVFARAIGDFKDIVLGYFFFLSEEEAKLNLKEQEHRFEGINSMIGSAVETDLPENKRLDDYWLTPKAYGLRSNIQQINKATKHFGFFQNDADDDAINRWVTLVANVDGHLMPSLALKSAAEHLGGEIVTFFNDDEIESIVIVNREDNSSLIELPIDPYGRGRMLINPRGGSGTFPHFSIGKAYGNSFSKEERERLKGKSLLFGMTATGTNDVRPNVFDPTIDGVENHLTAMDNIAAQDWFKRSRDSYAIELMTIILVGIVVSPILMWSSALISGSSIFLLVSGYLLYEYNYWFKSGTWTYIGIPLLQVFGMFILCILYRYFTEEREKKKVQGVFEHYLNPDVVDQMLNDPEAMALGGLRKEITVFFSDVRGFTTISEALTPEDLCKVMNDYFTPMTAIILDSRGTLDKYIGDAIMAFWGSPVPIKDHPRVAALSSIEMLYALDRLRIDFQKKGFPELDIGIGLNTGPMSVGNMGSGTRFSYTVMGDNVNLGARLEALTKNYGIKILMTEFTAKHLDPAELVFRDLDDIRVKGKNEPVKVFELMRPDYISEVNLRAAIDLKIEFESVRKAYAIRDWEAAENHLEKCFLIKPDDGPSHTYAKRIQQYKSEDPGEGWDGVFVFKSKTG